jgi:SAM-dependent methyltransferase
MFWFEKKDPRAIYVDKRSERWQRPPSKTCRNGRMIEVKPDVVADFTKLPFPCGSFSHVVFDPPFTFGRIKTGFLGRHYGHLPSDWREVLRCGFAECFRVLKPRGTLVFKWCEVGISLHEVLALTHEKPLYGHRTGAKARTHWVAFIKA